MTIRLPKDLESRVEAAVASGRFASVDEAMVEAARLLLLEIERTKPAMPPANEKNAGFGSIGAMRHAADELDEMVADAYARRNEPWREIAVE